MSGKVRNLLIAVAVGAFAARAAGADLKALVEKLPAQTTAEAHAVYEEILKGAPASLLELTRMVQVPEKDNDAKVRYALHGLAHYVKRPGAEAQRKVFTAVLLRQLDSDLPKSVKGFLIRQLHLAGGREAIEGIGKRLLDPELSEYAAQALLAIGDPAAVAQFRQALPKARGRVRLTIIQDLGVLRAARGLNEVRAALGAKDREGALAGHFEALAAMDTEGARLALEYLRASKAIGEKLVADGVAASAEVVNGVLTNGFFHLYGPINEYAR